MGHPPVRVHIAPTYPLACLLVLVFMQLILVFLLPGGGIPDASVKYVADLMEDLHSLPTIEELASLISTPLKKPLPIMDFLFTELGDMASFVPTQPLSQVCGVHVLSQVCGVHVLSQVCGVNVLSQVCGIHVHLIFPLQ